MTAASIRCSEGALLFNTALVIAGALPALAEGARFLIDASLADSLASMGNPAPRSTGDIVGDGVVATSSAVLTPTCHIERSVAESKYLKLTLAGRSIAQGESVGFRGFLRYRDTSERNSVEPVGKTRLRRRGDFKGGGSPAL